MKLLLLETWRNIRSSFWFVPTLMVAGAVWLAFSLLRLDLLASQSGDGPPVWLAVAGPEAARSLLSTIAGSMITVAGVTFSIVIVALTLASSQHGPRLLAGFMEDKGNQVVLGTFISVFVYCLVVMLHLPGSAGSRSLPQSSVLTGVVLAVVGVGVLIYFIHHISTSIQAGNLVVEAGKALERTIRATVPDGPREQSQPWPPKGFSEANARIPSPRSGYLSTLDPGRLVAIARHRGLRLMVVPRAGDFVLAGQTLVEVSPADALDDGCAQSICEAIALVDLREDAADLPLAIERLTEMAVRGLSPGINDPYTAQATIHRLTAGLDELLERLPAATEHRDDEGVGRLYVRPPEGQELLELAYGPIRRYGAADCQVLECLLESLASLGQRRRPRWEPALLEQMDRVLETARQQLRIEDDRDRVIHRHRLLRATSIR